MPPRTASGDPRVRRPVPPVCSSHGDAALCVMALASHAATGMFPPGRASRPSEGSCCVKSSIRTNRCSLWRRSSSRRRRPIAVDLSQGVAVMTGVNVAISLHLGRLRRQLSPTPGAWCSLDSRRVLTCGSSRCGGSASGGRFSPNWSMLKIDESVWDEGFLALAALAGTGRFRTSCVPDVYPKIAGGRANQPPAVPIEEADGECCADRSAGPRQSRVMAGPEEQCVRS